jgi:hypothetical protein
MKITRIIAATAAPLALGGVLLATAGQASAAAAPAVLTASVQQQSPKAVTAHTYRAGVVDTTSQDGNATVNTPGGPQWATDNLAVTYTVTPVAGHPGTWNVRADSIGTFSALASPVTGNAWTGHGIITGWADYTVTSTGTASARSLPVTEPGSVSTPQILAQLFGDPSAQVAGGHYWFAYYPVQGHLYTQSG